MHTPMLKRPSWVRRVVIGVSVVSVLGPMIATTASAVEPPAARDGFNRVVVDGWGVSTSGNAWSLRGDATRFAVGDGAGQVTLKNDARGQSADLGGWTDTATSVDVMLAVDTVPNANGFYANIVARRIVGVGQYVAKLRLRQNAAPSLTLIRTDASTSTEVALTPETPITRLANPSPDTRLAVRVEALGTQPTTVRARVYLPSAPEPTTWDVVATDATAALQSAGGVSLNNYLSTSVTNGPITAFWDGLEVTPPAPALPASPTGLTGVTDPSGVIMRWTAVPGVDSYVLRRNGIVIWTGTQLTYLDASVEPSSTYGYTVSSRVSALESAPTPIVNVTTPAPPIRAAALAGSLAPGAARYAVPAGSFFVSPAGSDSNSGAETAPLRTISAAVVKATNGSSIVVRAGTYNETVQVPVNERLTIQNYPGEAVWLDGSVPVTNWIPDGTAWRIDGWTPRFDRSPTYTPGAPDGTNPSWQFINPAYPYAAYPEQVFYDGVSLKQVGTRAAVTTGTFFVDNATSRIFLGNNPSGRSVQVSNLQQALIVRSAGSVVRGIGVRRYAPSVPQLGAVQALGSAMTLENVVIQDSATTGLFVGADYGNNITLRAVTVERSGMLGVAATFADGLTLDSVRFVNNNVERFNTSPVSGGIKIARSRVIRIKDSTFSNNVGPGVWMDESVYDAVVSGNDMRDNVGHGLSFEISSKLLMVNNVLVNNGANGVKLNNAQSVELWNNTIVDSGLKAIWIVQDSRNPANPSTPGRDPRRPAPDPTVTWVLGPIALRNNVIARTAANCLLCVEDTALRRTAESIGVTAAGNLFVRADATAPRWSVVWASGQLNPTVFTTAAAFTTATGQNPNMREYVGAGVVDSTGKLATSVSNAQKGFATAITTTVATLAGQPVGTRAIGAWN